MRWKKKKGINSITNTVEFNLFEKWINEEQTDNLSKEI